MDTFRQQAWSRSRAWAARHPNIYASGLLFCAIAAVINAVVVVIHLTEGKWLVVLWNAAVLVFWLRAGASFLALVTRRGEETPPRSFKYWPVKDAGEKVKDAFGK